MRRTSVPALVSLFASAVAVVAITGTAFGQTPIDPGPKDCPEGETCYTFTCDNPCSGNITCINSTHLACCCTTAGTSTCKCKTTTGCDNPPSGTNCNHS